MVPSVRVAKVKDFYVTVSVGLHSVICIAALALNLGSPNVTAAQPATGGTESSNASAPVAPGFVVEQGVLYRMNDGARVAVTLPGPVRALYVAGDRAYVALGEHGAAVVRATRADDKEAVAVEKLIPVSHGEVTGFMVDGDNLWMQLSSTSAIRLHSESSSTGSLTSVVALPVAKQAETPSTGPTLVPVPEPELAGIAIAKVFDGQVLLNRGKSAGLRAGDRFKVIRKEQLSDEGGSFDGEREVAVLVVESLNENSARAHVWRGDRVAMGDQVEPADRNTDPSLMYPRQLHGFVEAEIHVRPLLNVGAAGAGVLMDDHLTYYAEHYYLGLRNDPFGIGFSEGGTAFTQSTFAEGGYNSRPFAIGLAVGFTSVYGDLQEMFDITSSDEASGNADPWTPGQPELGPWTQDMQHAFALGQRVRLGAMDGLNLLVSNTLLFFPGGGESESDDTSEGGFIWGGTNAKLSIPLAQRADLFIEGGGGVMGYAYGAVGVFTWLSGNGGPGSLGLMASAGGAGVWGARTQENLRYQYKNSDEIVVAGPMVSLGLRYRAGLGGD
jgi:hypothetical protein